MIEGSRMGLAKPFQIIMRHFPPASYVPRAPGRNWL